MNIKYIKHKDIDTYLWDSCVKSSKNSTIYAYSWFLNIVSPDWDALIANNYQFIMPIPKYKKLNLYYVKKPNFIQKLGIISNNDISDKIVDLFIKHIPKKFRIFDIPFYNDINCYFEKCHVYKRTNYELSLNKSYEHLYNNYSKNVKKNLKRALKNNLFIIKKFNIDLFMELKKIDDKSHVFKKFEKEYLSQLKNIIGYANKNNLGEMYFISTENSQYIAAIYFLIQDNIAVKFSTRTTLGKKQSAGFMMIDHFIKIHSNKNIILDFVGSDIKNIAYFNKGFGAIKKMYNHLYINRLFFPFNIFKK